MCGCGCVHVCEVGGMCSTEDGMCSIEDGMCSTEDGMKPYFNTSSLHFGFTDS